MTTLPWMRRGCDKKTPWPLVGAILCLLTGGVPAQEIEALVRELEALSERGEHKEVLDRVIDHVKKGGKAVEVIALGAHAALNAAEFLHAGSLADILVAESPEDPRGYELNGHALYRASEAALADGRGGGPFTRLGFLDAAAMYADARKHGGDTYEMAYFEAEARVMGLDSDRALAAANAALAIKPNDLAAGGLKGRILLAAKKNAEAASVFATLWEAHPEQLELAQLLVQSQLAAGDRAAARSSIVGACTKFPNDRVIFDAVFETARGDRPDTWLRGILEELKQLQPSNHFPVWYLGVLDQTQSRYEEALAHFDAYIAMRPTYPEGYFMRGDALRMLGRFVDAREALLKANARPGMDATVLADGFRSLILALIEKNQYASASPLQQLLLDITKDPREEMNLAVLKYQAGQPDESLRIYNQLVARDDLDLSLRAMVENYLALAHWGVGHLEQAESHLRRALEANDAELDAAENLGVLLLAVGRRDEAQSTLEQVTLKDSSRARAQYHLMRARHPEVLDAKTP